MWRCSRVKRRVSYRHALLSIVQLKVAIIVCSTPKRYIYAHILNQHKDFMSWIQSREILATAEIWLLLIKHAITGINNNIMASVRAANILDSRQLDPMVSRRLTSARRFFYKYTNLTDSNLARSTNRGDIFRHFRGREVNHGRIYSASCFSVTCVNMSMIPLYLQSCVFALPQKTYLNNALLHL